MRGLEKKLYLSLVEVRNWDVKEYMRCGTFTLPQPLRRKIKAALDTAEKILTATNTGRDEMPPACGNCLIGVKKCSAVYGQQSCHATLWRHFART